MNILGALNALSSPSAPRGDGGEADEDVRPPEDCRSERTDGANLMAQAMMRHERVSNRVHSGKKGL